MLGLFYLFYFNYLVISEQIYASCVRGIVEELLNDLFPKHLHLYIAIIRMESRTVHVWDILSTTFASHIYINSVPC